MTMTTTTTMSFHICRFSRDDGSMSFPSSLSLWKIPTFPTPWADNAPYATVCVCVCVSFRENVRLGGTICGGMDKERGRGVRGFRLSATLSAQSRIRVWVRAPKLLPIFMRSLFLSEFRFVRVSFFFFFIFLLFCFCFSFLFYFFASPQSAP